MFLGRGRLDRWKPLRNLFQGQRSESGQANEPRFIKTMVHAVKNREGTRRVVVYRRSDGCFEYAEEILDDLDEECCIPNQEFWWAVEPGSSGLYDSPETALREVGLEIGWLREQEELLHRLDAPINDSDRKS